MNHLLSILLFLCAALGGQAQTLTATVDRNPVGQGERFKYAITLEGAQGNISPPEFSGIDIVGGPSTSQQMSIMGGKTSVKITHTYFLSANKMGEIIIPPAVATIGNGEVKSNPITIKVIKSDQTTSGAQNTRSAGQKPKSTASKDELFIRIYTDKKKVVQGEQIVVSYVLYNRYRGFEMENYELPALTGFWKEEVKIDNVSWEKNYEAIGNKSYQKAYLVRQVLFAQRTGELEIGPFTLDARVGRSFFNRGQLVELRSNTVKIDVAPRPKAPAAFNGAVGSFNMEVKADRTEVKTNEAINLTIKISGAGNLKLINELPIEFPADFEVYDPKINDRISTNAGGVRGSRTFEYLIIPRYPGKYDLNAIEFTYFDPAQKNYRTETAEPLSIEVSKGANDDGAVGNVTRRKEDVEVLDTDIRHIDTSTPVLRKKNEFFAGSPLHFTMVGLPFLLLGALFIFKRRRDDLDADVVGTKRRRASKTADKHLSAAKKLLEKGERDGYHEELYRALTSYVGNKFNIAASSMDKAVIAERLSTQGMPSETVAQLNSVLTDCEMARFAPTTASADRSLLEKARTVIDQMESAA